MSSSDPVDVPAGADAEESVIQTQNEVRVSPCAKRLISFNLCPRTLLQLLRLLKQPDIADMVMATKRRIDAGEYADLSAAVPAPAGSASTAGASTEGAADSAPEGVSSHAFWDTQPVPKLSE